MVMKEMLICFLDAYLEGKNPEDTLRLLEDDAVSLGSGAQEVALNKKELRTLMMEGKINTFGNIRYELDNYRENLYQDDVYGVYCTVKISMSDENGGRRSYRTRLTLTAAKKEKVWRIISLHMSVPGDQQGKKEWFPIKYGHQAVSRLDASSGRKLVETMMSMLPGGIMGGYLEEGFPLYIINDAMLRYLGYTYDELVKKTGERMQEIIAPEDWERVCRAIYDGVEKSGGYDIQYRVVRKDGSRMWVRDRGHAITTEDGRKAMVSVMLDINEDIKLQEKLRQEIMEEPLTGILNRKGAISCFEKYLSKHQTGAMFLLDIDNFKQVNDTYGHQHGDRVLVLLAEILKNRSRKEDIVARMGGDEFMLFLLGCTDEKVLTERARNICSAFHEVGEEYNKADISISIGIAVSDGNTDFDQLYKTADERMYMVKKNGKGSFCFNPPHLA